MEPQKKNLETKPKGNFDMLTPTVKRSAPMIMSYSLGNKELELGFKMA